MHSKGRFEEIAIGICESKSLAKPSLIGNGAFKEAYLTVTSDNIPVALKVFDPDKCNLYRAEREIEAMLQCESPFIGKLYDWGTFNDNKSNSFLFMVEEYLHGGTLTDRLLSMPHNTIHVCDYGIALMNAVSHLKENFLVHRDIKPDNIMFRSADNVPILVDFGLVRSLNCDSLTLTFLQQGPGTPFYASPEQLNNDKHLIDWRSDQFSIGIVLGICLTGNHPYQELGMSDMHTVNQVTSRATCSREFSEKSIESGCGFLIKMVSPWPVDRFSRPDMIISKLEDLKKEIAG